MTERMIRVVPQSYHRFLLACDEAETGTYREVKNTLQQAAEYVRAGAVSRMAPKHARSAGGYRTRVRSRSAVVEQSLRKTTRQHPEWGRYQMKRALLPALAANEDRIVREFDQATARVEARFERD